MSVVWGVLGVVVVAGLVLVLLAVLGGIGTVELSLWVLGTAGALAVVVWREVERGRRPPAA